jgi:hypothetical protein
VLLGGLLLAFRTGTSEPSIAFVGGQDIGAVPGVGEIRPERPAEQIAPQAPVMIVPVQPQESAVSSWMGAVVLLGGVAIICAFAYNMFRLHLQYKKSTEFDEAMFP